jgi:hypothetical protein
MKRRRDEKEESKKIFGGYDKGDAGDVYYEASFSSTEEEKRT